MGTVYQAHDNRLTRLIAIKEFDPLQVPPQDRAAATAAFEQESRILAQLRHPGFTNISDYFQDGGKYYLAMELVKGETLEDAWVRAGGRFSEEQVIAWADTLCHTLNYLHTQNPPVIFRDIKPSNIMIQPNGELKLIDFGIARYFKPGQTKDTTALGTPGYAPPEQHGQAQADPRSDVYALGATLHQLLTGHDPAISPFIFPSIAQLAPQVSANTVKVIEAALQIDMDKRPFDAITFFTMLQGQATPPDDEKKNKKWLWIMGALLLILIPTALFASMKIIEPSSPAPATTTAQIITVEVTVPSDDPTTEAPPTDDPSTEVPPTDDPPTEMPPTDDPPTEVPPTVEPELPTEEPPTPVPPIDPLLGDGLVRLTDNGNANYTPHLSPDQRHLILASEINGYWQIIEVDPNGAGHVRQLTSGNSNSYSPRFSPNGRQILFTNDADGNQNIYLMNADTGQVVQQLTTDSRDDFYPFWLPDSSGFLFSSGRSGGTDIYRGSFDGSPPVQLTTDSKFDGFSAVSNDGRQITFYSARDGNYEIYTMDINGGNVQRLTFDSARDADPVFSPDGQWIAFESDRDGGGYEIYVMRTDGSGLTNMTNHQYGDWVPQFSPDGRWLLFQSTRNGAMDIYRMPFTMGTGAAPAETTTVIVNVSAGQPQTDTGLTVESGQTVTIEYVDGSWRAGTSSAWPFVGANGDPQVASKATFPVAAMPIMTLVGGIDGGTPFVVGENITFISPANGTLWLGANDDGFDDNAGDLNIRITVQG